MCKTAFSPNIIHIDTKCLEKSLLIDVWVKEQVEALLL